ncbi:MAG: PKD domain-containing protein [Planctomycetota bacterium]|nr:PKD domain-containing protein [Planctomycetota bacterium]
MAEILQQAYEYSGTNVVFGLEAGKGSANRSTWTDVDDYNGWTETTPQTKSGTVLGNFTGWTRSVLVEWIDPATLAATSNTNTGIKRITVTVVRRGKPVAVVAAYRTVGWVDTIPAPTDATGNHAPVAAATVDYTARRVGETATFKAGGSTDADSDTLTYVWKFGDGATSNLATAPHVYAAAGTYNATLTVYDGRGGAGIGTVTVTVTP